MTRRRHLVAATSSAAAAAAAPGAHTNQRHRYNNNRRHFSAMTPPLRLPPPPPLPAAAAAAAAAAARLTAIFESFPFPLDERPTVSFFLFSSVSFSFSCHLIFPVSFRFTLAPLRESAPCCFGSRFLSSFLFVCVCVCLTVYLTPVDIFLTPDLAPLDHHHHHHHHLYQVHHLQVWRCRVFQRHPQLLPSELDLCPFDAFEFFFPFFFVVLFFFSFFQFRHATTFYIRVSSTSTRAVFLFAFLAGFSSFFPPPLDRHFVVCLFFFAEVKFRTLSNRRPPIATECTARL